MITSLICGLLTKWTNLGGQKSEKVDFEKVFPPFHAFSTKTVPDFCGFQYLRISLSSQKISEYRGSPVIKLNCLFIIEYETLKNSLVLKFL